MNNRIVRLEDTQHLSNFPGYGVSTDGDVISFKNKKTRILKPGWKKKEHGYRNVVLCHKNGTKHNFLVHRLVALVFIPTEDVTLQVNHKNRNSSDNRLENLEWTTRQQNINHNDEVKGFTIDRFVLSKMKEIHSASIRKGLNVPPAHEFMNSLIEGQIEQYINQYGLRKVMNSVGKP